MKDKIQGPWYERNKDDYNQRRRERYQTDKAHREAIQQKAREAKKAKIAERKGMVERVWNGEVLLAKRIGDVAEEIGVSIQVIRSWEINQIIPRPVFGGKQRVYTETQVELMRKLAEALTKAKHYNKYSEVKSKLQLYIENHWIEGLR